MISEILTMARMPNRETWRSLTVLVLLLTLGACSSNTKTPVAEAGSSKGDYFTRLNAANGPSIAALKRYGVAERVDQFVFVDRVLELGESANLSADPAIPRAIDYSVDFSRITRGYVLARDPSIQVFEHPITLTRAATHDRPVTERVTASGAPSISGWGAMTAWQGDKLIHCNSVLASWIVLKPSTRQLPLFFVYHDSLENGGPIQLSIYASYTGRKDDNTNLGIFYLDAAAKGHSYEMQPGELCNGYPVLKIIRKGAQSVVAATLIYDRTTKQFEVVGGSEGSIE
jgi:hypothetical protein